MLVLVTQYGQVRAAPQAGLLTAATLVAVAAAFGASLVAALAPLQHFTVVAFEEHRLSGVHILAAKA